MPIKLALKPKITPALAKTTNPSNTTQEISDLIDKIGGMQDAVTKAKVRIKRDTDTIIKPYTDAMKALVALLNAVPGKADDQEFERHGDQFEITAGKKMVSRSVSDMKAAITKLNKIKPGLGFELATVTLGNLDKYVSPNEQEAFVTKTPSDRSVKEIRARPKLGASKAA